MNDKERIDEAASQFPETFGLRGNPNLVFCINRQYSYANDDGRVKLVVDVLINGKWLNFSKGTVEEVKAAMIKL